MPLIPKSYVPGVVWPAIGDQSSVHAMALQYQLQNSEWDTPETLLSTQLYQASGLVNYAYNHNTFYKAHYAKQSFKPKEIITAHDWKTVPIIKRLDIQAASADLITRIMPEHHGASVDISTSGSTGQQITVKTNQIMQLFWQAFGLRDEIWHERNLRGKLCVIKLAPKNQGEPPHGSVSDRWGKATDMYHTGQAALLDISATLEQQVDWLVKHQPHYFLTYPSNLIALSKVIKKRNIRFNHLLGIKTLGEIVTDEARQVCRDVFKVPLHDVYSCQEAGYLALQCPENEHYHVMSEGVLLEVLDENDQACKVGQVGRVVITSLHNFVTPLIRYEIGDYAEVGEPCSCERGLPVLKRIIGRVRNMVIHPDGTQHWPYVGSSLYRDVANIKQFQLIQTDPKTIEFHLVIDEKLSDDQKLALVNIIQRALRYKFTIVFKYQNEIKRSAGGKYEDFISYISGGL